MELTIKNVRYAIIGLLILQAFNGLSGLLGGFMLIKDPTGANLTMDMAWLEGTPFTSFLVPGIILFSVNGVGNITGFWFSLKNKNKAGILASIFGAVMMIWITTQVILIGYKDFLQPLYFASGLSQMILGFLVHFKTR